MAGAVLVPSGCGRPQKDPSLQWLSTPMQALPESVLQCEGAGAPHCVPTTSIAQERGTTTPAYRLGRWVQSQHSRGGLQRGRGHATTLFLTMAS